MIISSQARRWCTVRYIISEAQSLLVCPCGVAVRVADLASPHMANPAEVHTFTEDDP